MNYSIPKDQDLEYLFEQLETHALQLDLFEIAGKFKKLRDKKEEEGNLEIAKIAQWEIRFFFYDSSPIKDQDYKERIPWDRYEEEQLDYLIKRQKEVKNKLIKAHYSHILWLSPRKEIEFGRDAVDSYLWLSEQYIQNQEIGLRFINLRILDVIINGYNIAMQIKYKTKETKDILISVLKDYKQDDVTVAVIKLNLIDLVIRDRKNFTETDLKEIEQVCESYSNGLMKKTMFLDAITLLENGQRVSSILKQNVVNWVGKIAYCYENLMKENEKKNINLSLDFCESAIRKYRKAGNEKKVKELEKQFAQLKEQLKFVKISPPISEKEKIELLSNIKEYEEEFRLLAEKLVKEKSSDEIIHILMHDKSFVPKLDEIEKRTEKALKKMILSQFVTTDLIDSQRHKAEVFQTEEERKKFVFLHNYRNSLDFRYIFLKEVILAAIRNEKLNYSILERFLVRNSWLGKKYTRYYPNQHKVSFNWVKLLSPSLKNYFQQISKYLENNSYVFNYVLCIDSLVFKIEGILRDLCKFMNVPTSYFPRNKDVVREKDINQLLREEKLKTKIDADDLFFFKFVLIEKGGYNLRHRVAHSLLLPEDYSFYLMNFLFLITVKLAQFYVTISEENEE